MYNLEVKLDFDHVLIQPKPGKIPSRSLVSLTSNHLKNKLGIDTTGIIAANMDGVGTFEVAEVLRQYGCMTALHKHYPVEDLVEHFSSDASSHSFYSMGISEPDLIKFNTVVKQLPTLSTPLKICIDVANGYMEHFGTFCRVIKSLHPEAIVMAGNVVDIHGVRNVAGVDIVKLGIGQGSNCLTRTQTGIGYPQLSCVYDTHNDCEYYDIDVILCSDGGCTTPGDVSKALVAGAYMVMLGGMLAGTDQGGGDVIELNGKKYVEFYGMSSATAQKKHNGGLKDYRSSEGRTTLVPYKGNMHDVIKNILGGVVSSCTYTGSAHIDELSANGTFIRVQNVINTSMAQYTIGM